MEEGEAASHLLQLSEKAVSSSSADDEEAPAPKSKEARIKPSIIDFHAVLHPNCKYADSIKRFGAIPYLHTPPGESRAHVDFLLPNGTLDCFLYLKDKEQKDDAKWPVIQLKGPQEVQPQLRLASSNQDQRPFGIPLHAPFRQTAEPQPPWFANASSKRYHPSYNFPQVPTHTAITTITTAPSGDSPTSPQRKRRRSRTPLPSPVLPPDDHVPDDEQP